MTTELLSDEQIDEFYEKIRFLQADHWLTLHSVCHQAKLANRRASPAQDWMPIETAPRDGSAVIVANDCGSWIAKYYAVYQSGYKADSPWFSLMLNHDHIARGGGLPTKWQPLPAPSVDAASGGRK